MKRPGELTIATRKPPEMEALAAGAMRRGSGLGQAVSLPQSGRLAQAKGLGRATLASSRSWPSAAR